MWLLLLRQQPGAGDDSGGSQWGGNLLWVAALLLLPLFTEALMPLLRDSATRSLRRAAARVATARGGSSAATSVTFVGYEIFRMFLPAYDFPSVMFAVSHNVARRNLAGGVLRCLDAPPPARSGSARVDTSDTVSDDSAAGAATRFRYELRAVLSDATAIALGDDVWLDVSTETMGGDGGHSSSATTMRTTYTLYAGASFRGGVQGLMAFVARCEAEYAAAQANAQSNQLLHILYTGRAPREGRGPTFRVTPLADTADPLLVPLERFATLASPHVTRLMDDLARLRDVAFYARTGQKRKKGYVFHGAAGTGKTSHVVAMALHDGRHILEVPMSRVHTNADLEDVLSTNVFNGVCVPPEKLIILFDEMDLCVRPGVLQGARDELVPAGHSRRRRSSRGGGHRHGGDDDSDGGGDDGESDALHLGTILSRLDGVGAYDGLVVVATTNTVDTLPLALVRPGRLTPLLFGPLRGSDAAALCATFYDSPLLQFTEVAAAVGAPGATPLSPAELRGLLEQHADATQGVEAILLAVGRRHRKNRTRGPSPKRGLH